MFLLFGRDTVWIDMDIATLKIRNDKVCGCGCACMCGWVCKLCNGKAVGQDEVAAELLKYGGKVIIDWLTEVIQQVWQSRKNPR